MMPVMPQTTISVEMIDQAIAWHSRYNARMAKWTVYLQGRTKPHEFDHVTVKEVSGDFTPFRDAKGNEIGMVSVIDHLKS